jgi:CDP-diglyceride synthetase
MKITKTNIWYVKAIYIGLAGLLAIGAIISVIYHMQYMALVFIVAASIVILIGTFVFAHLFKQLKLKNFRDM